MCKLVTVNCLSQYSGCKCILTFTNKNHFLKVRLILTHFSSCELTRQDRQTGRHITHGTLMISWMCLSVDFISLLYFWNLGMMLNRAICLILVCVVVLQMSTVILCVKVPQRCTAWIIMCPIHCELMQREEEKKKKNQPINFDFGFE